VVRGRDGRRIGSRAMGTPYGGDDALRNLHIPGGQGERGSGQNVVNLPARRWGCAFDSSCTVRIRGARWLTESADPIFAVATALLVCVRGDRSCPTGIRGAAH